MTSVRAKIQKFSQERLMLILGVYILCQPLLDVLTALGARAGHPITAGVVVRALFMALGLLYAVFISEFQGKRLPMIYTGVLAAYLALFMIHMLMVGGISLCFANLTDVVKTFFAPFVLVFLYCIYKQYGFSVTTQSIGAAGAIYTSVILLAYLTGTSFQSYGNSGFGFNGWFYAANEIGCIIALAAPFTVYHCVRLIPTITKKTWWKGAVILWCLASVVFSANFIGTKIVFLFNLLYCMAALVWMLFHLGKERSLAVLCQVGVLLVTVVAIMGIYLHSSLKDYIDTVYIPIQDATSEEVSSRWEGEIRDASEGTWLRQVIADVPFVQRIDQIFSRRLFTAAPSVQAYIEGDALDKLLGVGYASTDAYDWDINYMVEMDPPAILIRHGIVGFVVYCVPYFAFIVYALIQFFKRPLLRLSSLRYCTLLYCTLVGCAIATVAGHALVSPAVSTFLVVTGVQLWICTQEQNKLPGKKNA